MNDTTLPTVAATVEMIPPHASVLALPVARRSDLDRKAEQLERALASAHRANRRVTEAMRAFVADHPAIGPLQRETFVNRCCGVEGDLGQIHLDITSFDSRPRPRDGGGGK